MDLEKHPNHSRVSDQQTQAKDDPRPLQVPWLERCLERIGFFDRKYNAMYMICLGLCPYLLDCLVCRRCCDIEDCRFYRNTASRGIDIILWLYFLRIHYLIWSRDRQKADEAAKNASVVSSQLGRNQEAKGV